MEYRLRQIAASTGTEGTVPTWNSIETAANARVLLYEPQFTPEVQRAVRNPFRAQLGKLSDVPTSKRGQIAFSTELKGSGTPGVTPALGVFLRGCGMAQTINNGTAVIGAASRVAGTGTGAAPTLAGTFTGTKSGRLELLITDLIADTSITIQASFYPGDGTAPSVDAFTQTSSSPITLTGVAAGVTFDFGEPETSTEGYVNGDRFVAKLTSSSQVDVRYTFIDNTASDPHPVLNLSFFHSGRLHRLYSARGSCVLNGSIDNYATAEFTFSGVYDDTVDKALLTGIDYGDVVPAPFLNLQDFNLFGNAGCFSEISVDFGNTLAERLCANSPAGLTSFRITERDVVGSINPYSQLVSAFDTFGLLQSGATGALDFTLGTTAGNIVEFNAPRAQIIDIGDDEAAGQGVDSLSLGFRQPESSETNEFSEFTLIFR